MGAEKRLTAAEVQHAPAGRLCDGGGLWLVKRSARRGQWVLRVTVHNRRREMGLGPISKVTLKKAREDAARWRALAYAGTDPIVERERLRREAARSLHLLRDVAEDAFEARKAELKRDGKAGRWYGPIALHILPKLGSTPVAQLDQIAIRDALRPIWQSKAVTADKALKRLGIVMRHAAALGLDVDLQATTKARALLGRQRHEAANIPALTWQDVPAFYASLSDGTVTHLALRLLILTGVRSGPLRHLRGEHLAGDVWTIPRELMKGRLGHVEDFAVPLVPEALAVIAEASRHARRGFLFPSTRKGVISDATMSALMRRRGLDARPHGFRSALRTYLDEATDCPRDLAEMVLGHVVGNAVERAYRRTDLIEKRRVYMERWAKFVAGNDID